MKNRVVTYVLAILLALGMVAAQALQTSTPEDAETPVVTLELPDGTEGEEASGQATTGQEASGSQGQATSAGDATVQGADSLTPEQDFDLGPDIELGEGITDARLQQAQEAAGITLRKDGSYTSKVEVALYIHTYGRVPSNYISKTKARNAGWDSSKGNLWDVLPGMSIGGGGYMNEQWDDGPLLPETPEGRDWRECDINYQGGYRGAERLVYSDDGLVFYTGDHYETFERLY